MSEEYTDCYLKFHHDLSHMQLDETEMSCLCAAALFSSGKWTPFCWHENIRMKYIIMSICRSRWSWGQSYDWKPARNDSSRSPVTHRIFSPLSREIPKSNVLFDEVTDVKLVYFCHPKESSGKEAVLGLVKKLEWPPVICFSSSCSTLSVMIYVNSGLFASNI